MNPDDPITRSAARRPVPAFYGTHPPGMSKALMNRLAQRAVVPEDHSLAGLVVAGGYSRRFGEADKAVADVDGSPMIRRIATRLSRVVDDLVINCRAEQVDPIGEALEGLEGRRFAVDPVPDRGPLAGIHTGLSATDAEYAAVVACDLPFLRSEAIEALADRARGRDGAIYRSADGKRQPLSAVYRTEPMRRTAAEALARDERRVLAAVDRLDCTVVTARDVDGVGDRTFESVDTRRALQAARDRLDSAPAAAARRRGGDE